MRSVTQATDSTRMGVDGEEVGEQTGGGGPEPGAPPEREGERDAGEVEDEVGGVVERGVEPDEGVLDGEGRDREGGCSSR